MTILKYKKEIENLEKQQILEKDTAPISAKTKHEVSENSHPDISGGIKNEESDDISKKAQQKLNEMKDQIVKDDIIKDTSNQWNRPFCLRIIGEDRKGVHLKKLKWEILRSPELKKRAEEFYLQLMGKK